MMLQPHNCATFHTVYCMTHLECTVVYWQLNYKEYTQDMINPFNTQHT